MDSPWHFDPCVEQRENIIYHSLSHRDLGGGAQMHCKNICSLITIPQHASLGGSKHAYRMGEMEGESPKPHFSFFPSGKRTVESVASSIME